MIDKVVISTRATEAMRGFYDAVFAAGLKPVNEAMPGLYAGALGPVVLMLCPSAISGVDVQVNNIQLRIVVDDVRAVHAAALAHGGAAISPEPEGSGSGLTWDIRDPDGNSIELRQRAAGPSDP